MDKLAYAVNQFASRVEPTYPFNQRPVVYVSGEPGITVRAFKKQQIECLKTLTEEPFKGILSTHFKGIEFEVTRDERIGAVLVASPFESPLDLPTYILVSTFPAWIELNFKRSHCVLTSQDIDRYLAFIKEILGESLSEERKS